ncbi:MAG: FkbM family methyltransferase [Candidatus Eisenbacteria bacterium]
MKRLINSVRRIEDCRSFWKEYCALKREAPETREIRIRLRNGPVVLLPGGLMSAFNEVFLRDVYGVGSMAALGAEPVVVDIGANAGFFTLFLLSLRPRAKVLAFEPIPENRVIMERQKRLNPGLDFVIDPRAVFGERKTTEIGYDGRKRHPVGASLLPRDEADMAIPVETITLPDLFSEYSLDRCDLLKIDGEGAEFEILYRCPGALYESIRAMVVEVHSWAGGRKAIDDLVRFLEGNVYVVRNRKYEIVTCRRQG